MIVVDYYVYGGSFFDCSFCTVSVRVITLTELHTTEACSFPVFMTTPCFLYGAGSTKDSNQPLYW